MSNLNTFLIMFNLAIIGYNIKQYSMILGG